MQHFRNKDPQKAREENRRLLEEQWARDEGLRQEKEKKARKKKTVIGIAVFTVLLLTSWAAYYSFSPGRYDDFAKCLTEKGAVMYGEDWCRYTQGQKGMFGKSFKYINYQVKTNLNIRPTWIVDGKSYEGVQSFERLSALTGCKF